jgi:hypothetical protein
MKTAKMMREEKAQNAQKLENLLADVRKEDAQQKLTVQVMTQFDGSIQVVIAGKGRWEAVVQDPHADLPPIPDVLNGFGGEGQITIHRVGHPNMMVDIVIVFAFPDSLRVVQSTAQSAETDGDEVEVINHMLRQYETLTGCEL